MYIKIQFIKTKKSLVHSSIVTTLLGTRSGLTSQASHLPLLLPPVVTSPELDLGSPNLAQQSKELQLCHLCVACVLFLMINLKI